MHAIPCVFIRAQIKCSQSQSDKCQDIRSHIAQRARNFLRIKFETYLKVTYIGTKAFNLGSLKRLKMIKQLEKLENIKL